MSETPTLDANPFSSSTRHTRSLFAEYIQPRDETYVTAEGGAAALWVPPGGHAVEPDEAEQFGARLESAAGIDAPRTLRSWSCSMSTTLTAPSYFLNLLAVLPERQGQGLGSALLAHTLDRCDREGVPAYLDATSEDNRRLYERHGFEAGAPVRPGRRAAALPDVARPALLRRGRIGSSPSPLGGGELAPLGPQENRSALARGC